MSDILIEVGHRIRDCRKAQGMSQKDLADKYVSISNETISTNMISLWENGKRRLFADQLYYLCLAIETQPSFVYPRPNIYNEEMNNYDMNCLTEQERLIMYYVFMKWNGNVKALIHFIGLYVSLPRQLRQDIAGMGCHIYKLGLDGNQIIPDAPDINLEYIIEQTDKLWNWKQGEM